MSSEFIQLALTAVNFLARSIVEDLQESVFDILFTVKWEKGNILSGLTTAKTLEDYFNDVMVWLPTYFFAKFTAEILPLVATAYVRAIKKREERGSKGKGLTTFLLLVSNDPALATSGLLWLAH